MGINRTLKPLFPFVGWLTVKAKPEKAEKVMACSASHFSSAVISELGYSAIKFPTLDIVS